VDCASLVLSLLESELFGYIRGAFTGAGQQKRGLIEAANGGTLFLDEIGDLPIDAQAKLLRVLQEHEIRPVGGLDRIPVDFRLISATNQDLDAAVKAGKFRQDLYFRLNVVQLRLPPLRERRADIPLLAANMIAEMADPHHARRLGEDVMRWMATYDWPGNVRELEHAIERALALSSEPVLHLQDFFEGRIETSEDRRVEAALGTLGEMKHRAILAALRISGGDVRAAARILGISNTTMYRKVQEIRLESETTGTGARDNLERHG
jgi:two-component system response regulator HydG